MELMQILRYVIRLLGYLILDIFLTKLLQYGVVLE